MFPGPAQRKQIDKIGQIFSGFLSTRFRGPNPSNLRMFEKWKQYCWQVFLRAFFWCDLRKTNQNSFIMSPNFPWPALPKKTIYIYISIFVQFFCRRFSRDQPSKKINICIYIYSFFCFFVQFFFADFSAASPPFPPQKKHTFCSFFCRRFARGQPSKKYKS